MLPDPMAPQILKRTKFRSRKERFLGRYGRLRGGRNGSLGVAKAGDGWRRKIRVLMNVTKKQL
jgi:hypothetical protein